ncbi:uncharacterized protein BO66DRAFT_251272 [Aspergillus aculeatinus CBS 121060]|uniref:Uncharacterized protein n=1 Tax=Aspergillus aculeatinus CBS 121060 TaxID=1448322 RepID=A0ACD1HHP6_9EURO|nr:hypothetical protein BO66DRAFT_251272 [Aspergillus aculeatinus CBS 121060]RAH72961.1 hypothetical protein BO66DRAFT_251272 [Aspergillus aculeatinus CBS 121060]
MPKSFIKIKITNLPPIQHHPPRRRPRLHKPLRIIDLVLLRPRMHQHRDLRAPKGSLLLLLLLLSFFIFFAHPQADHILAYLPPEMRHDHVPQLLVLVVRGDEQVRQVEGADSVADEAGHGDHFAGFLRFRVGGGGVVGGGR